MSAIMTAEERYLNDGKYNSLVQALFQYLKSGYSIRDMNEAFNYALERYREYKLREDCCG